MREEGYKTLVDAHQLFQEKMNRPMTSSEVRFWESSLVPAVRTENFMGVAYTSAGPVPKATSYLASSVSHQ